jgi:hypothetical protein
LIYNYVIVPTYDYIIIPIYNGVTKLFQLIIDYIFIPILNGITFLITSIIEFMVSVGNFIYENVILPISKMLNAIFSAIANLIRSLTSSIARVFA